MELHELSPAPGSKKARTRVGRGMGSGKGKTCGSGQDGQKSRSGYSRKLGFEGGQMPLIRRVPKRGFTNIFAKKISIVNIESLNIFEDGSIIGPDELIASGLVKREQDGIKVLGSGDLNKKLTVRCNMISESAKAKVESAGGKVEVI